jgi:hypothetical protein
VYRCGNNFGFSLELGWFWSGSMGLSGLPSLFAAVALLGLVAVRVVLGIFA